MQIYIQSNTSGKIYNANEISFNTKNTYNTNLTYINGEKIQQIRDINVTSTNIP